MKEILQEVKLSSKIVASLKAETKRKVLKEMANVLRENTSYIGTDGKGIKIA